jgi:DNA invertase Pin-like site-specific DNA recombinase
VNYAFVQRHLQHGRPTLKVLSAFAQFERGVIGERVQDKVAASERKGLWTGAQLGPLAPEMGEALGVAGWG